MARFDPDECDLCGSRQYEVLANVPGGRAMRSDRDVVAASLTKRACARCGLARSGGRLADEDLDRYYAEEYTLGLRPEHSFYTPSGPVARSAVFADWLTSGTGAIGAGPWGEAKRVIEIGAGSGLLLDELAHRFPDKIFAGIEPGRGAAAAARSRGVVVRDHAPDDREPYDLAYAIAVLEHVPSPTAFLRDIRQRLRQDGFVLLSQPTQDVPSYDVLFIDHLHHFGTAHLAAYARKCGFREEAVAVGHPLMPNFSLHLWQAAATTAAETAGTETAGVWVWSGPAAPTTCRDTVTRVLTDMARLDTLLTRLAREGRRVAAFGLSEVYWLCRAYSSLANFPLVCGLDDAPENPEYARLAFPVRTPETCLDLGVQDVLLMMNRIYYETVMRRLARLGLVAHAVLS